MDLDSSLTALEEKVNYYILLASKVNDVLLNHSNAIKEIKSIQSIQNSFSDIEKGLLESISLPIQQKVYSDITDHHHHLITSYISPLMTSIETYLKLNYTQVNSGISELQNVFLSKWSEVTKKNCSTKEIIYSDGSRYIGKYTIHKDEKLIQTIIKSNFGILYYKDNINTNITNILIGNFSNDIFTEGILIHRDLIYIGNFNKKETEQTFNGIILSISNNIFLGSKTDTINENPSTIYEGITIEQVSNNPNIIRIYHKGKAEVINQQDQVINDNQNNYSISTLTIQQKDNNVDKDNYIVTLNALLNNLGFLYDSQKYLFITDYIKNECRAVFYIMNDYSIYNGPIKYETSTQKFRVKNKGIVLYSNNDIYYGNIEDNIKNGYGEYYANESGYYCKGQYFNDIFIEGEIKKQDNTFKANGMFANGFVIEKGKVHFSNSDTYNGDFNSNLKYNGKGQYDYIQSFNYNNKPVIISYNGYWTDGVKDGKGKLTIKYNDSSSNQEVYSVNYTLGSLESID